MNRFFLLVLSVALVACGASDRAPEATSGVHVGSTINVNASQSFQTIAGLGVNGQPRMWGTGTASRPALATLVQEMNATLWRVEINSGLSNWEATNDNSDPFVANWTYYDALFQTKPFADLFAYIRYLNSLGVTNIVLAAHGDAPSWMGGSNVPTSQFDEYVETQLAVLEYARVRIPEPKPVFRWYSLFNEPDCGCSSDEGIVLSGAQAGELTRRFAVRLAAETAIHPELAGLKMIAPDAAQENNVFPGFGYHGAITSNVPASQLEAIAHHNYGNLPVNDYNGIATPEWVTETNGFRSTCGPTTWAPHGLDLATSTLNFLRNGNAAVLVWTEWDAPHSHDLWQWRTMGLLGAAIPGVACGDAYPSLSNAQLDSAVYSKKPTYHAFRQLAAFVQPGAKRILASTSDTDLNVIAVQNPDGNVAVLGVNTGAAGTVIVNLSGTSATVLTAWTTTASAAFVQGPPVLAASGSASFAIPASSVFAIAPTPGTSCTPANDAGSEASTVAEGGSDGGVDASSDGGAGDGSDSGTEVAADGDADGGGTSDSSGGDGADGGMDVAIGDSGGSDQVEVGDGGSGGDAGVADAEAGAPRVLVGESTQWTSGDSIGSGAIESFKYTAALTGNATKLSVYLTVAGRATKLGLYTHNAAANQPQTLLASGAFTSVVGWNTITVPAFPVTAGATYWIAILATNGTLSFVEKTGSGLGSVSTGGGFSALPATWSTSGQSRWASSGMSAYGRE